MAEAFSALTEVTSYTFPQMGCGTDAWTLLPMLLGRAT
jgi:hypothetical protein